MNGEYFKRMDPKRFFSLASDTLSKAVKTPDVDLIRLAEMCRTRVSFINDIYELTDFIDELPVYSPDLYVNKKMKTAEAVSLESLKSAEAFFRETNIWTNETLYGGLVSAAGKLGFKNSQMLWPVRSALSGKPSSPCGASELAALLGRDETLKRVKVGIEALENV
jgi:glutamyl-tRNA synthetase